MTLGLKWRQSYQILSCQERVWWEVGGTTDQTLICKGFTEWDEVVEGLNRRISGSTAKKVFRELKRNKQVGDGRWEFCNKPWKSGTKTAFTKILAAITNPSLMFQSNWTLTRQTLLTTLWPG